MRRVTIRALGYKETELISRATLRALLKYETAAPAVGATLLRFVLNLLVYRADIAQSPVSTERKR